MSENSYTKPLVLVIDDDEAIRAYLSALTHEHAETIEAASGDKGIAIAKSRVPDLILLDLMMPGTDGYQVCKALKQNTATKHIPVIFITAQTDRAFEAAALKLGAIDYIVKPFDTDIVAAKVKNHLTSIAQEENISSSIRQRNTGKYAAAAAVVIALGLGGAAYQFFGGDDDHYTESAAPAPAPTRQVAAAQPNAFPSPPPATPSATAPAPTITAPQPAPPSTTTPPVNRLITKAPAAPKTLPETARPSTRPTAALTQESQAVTDRRHQRPTDKYGWVKEAHCGVVQLVEWWQNITPSSIALYVDKHHDGIWEPYATKWQKHLIRTENTMIKGGALKAPNGTVLKDAKLREFVAKLRKRVDVVECLSRAAERRAVSGS